MHVAYNYPTKVSNKLKIGNEKYLFFLATFIPFHKEYFVILNQFITKIYGNIGPIH